MIQASFARVGSLLSTSTIRVSTCSCFRASVPWLTIVVVTAPVSPLYSLFSLALWPLVVELSKIELNIDTNDHT